MIRSVFLSSFVLSLMPSLAVLAQEPGGGEEASGSQQPVFNDTVRVDLVNVDVRVTDAHGDPVRDLTAADFQVFEDGRPVTVTNFAFVDDRLRLHPRSRLPSPPPEPSSSNTPPELGDRGLPPGEGVDEEDRLRLVLFFDNDDIDAQERNRVLPRVEGFVRRTLGPDDLAMVASYERSLKIRQQFTSDTNVIADALHELEDARTLGSQRERERNDVLRTLDETKSSDVALTSVTNHADLVFNEMGFVVEGLKKMIDFLAGLPGRKALVHVSGGMPMSADLDLFYAVHEKFSDSHALSYAARYDMSRQLEEVFDRANANGVTMYMLDAKGLRPAMAGAAEFQGLHTAGMMFRLDSDNQSNLQSSLHYLADETGGRAIVNQNDLGPAFEVIESDLRTFYSLGYVPAHPGDGSHHDIKVKVQRKGVQVRHRSGYQDKSLETRMIEGTRAALLHSLAKNPFGVALSIEGQAAQADGNYRVQLVARVPLRDVAIIPTDAEHSQVRLRFFVTAMDEEGRISHVEQVPAGLRLEKQYVAAAHGQAYLHRQQLLMRRGRQRIALGVLDELSGQYALLSETLTVGR